MASNRMEQLKIDRLAKLQHTRRNTAKYRDNVLHGINRNFESMASKMEEHKGNGQYCKQIEFAERIGQRRKDLAQV